MPCYEFHETLDDNGTSGAKLLLWRAFIFAATVLGFSLSGCQAADEPVVFKDKDTLLGPTDYRERVFVGSLLGLGYNQGFAENMATIYHNVYINSSSFRAFTKRANFPMVL